jgi:hypothetical protein
MFHDYVRASTGRKIDIGRAQFLMDDDIRARIERRGLDTQGFWEAYREAHRAKHGEPFRPYADPEWDR